METSWERVVSHGSRGLEKICTERHRDNGGVDGATSRRESTVAICVTFAVNAVRPRTRVALRHGRLGRSKSRRYLLPPCDQRVCTIGNVFLLERSIGTVHRESECSPFEALLQTCASSRWCGILDAIPTGCIWAARWATSDYMGLTEYRTKLKEETG